MNKKLISLLLAVIMIISAFVLSSCSEKEPLPEGVSALPDLDASELAASLADESGVIQWPAELLPDDMPAAEYTEIYSVERVDNEVTIILFGENNYTKKANAKAYMQKLVNNGYVPIDDELTGMRYFYNKDGCRVALAESSSWTGEYLQAVNETSPTGYTYEIKVFQTGKTTECLFWEFPDENTDLGLEPMTFEEWPTGYLPENFPRPGEKIEIIEMKQEKNGLFITVKGVSTDVLAYQAEIFRVMGYITSSAQPYRNPNGDYMYYTNLDFKLGGSKDDPVIVTDMFQICPANDLIEKTLN